MANKSSVADWDVTPINNDNVGGVDISEGCAPSGINNALRALMGQVKAFHTGVQEMETDLATELAGKASPADIQTAINALLGAAPAQLDTLVELAAALGNDGNYAATTTAALAARLRKDQNLADLPSPATARANLGVFLGSGLPNQNADTCFAEGTYQTGSTWTGSISPGEAGGNQGYLRVRRWGSDAYVTQEFLSVNGAFQKFERRRDNSVWEPWRRVFVNTVTISTAAPSGGSDGDLWFQYLP